MPTILRQSTQIKVRIGPAVAVGDGFTPVTTLSLGSADEAELLKADGAATSDISGATFAAVTGADGWYDLTLTTTHTNTVGELVVVVNDDSLILPIYQRFQVVEEAIYDALFAASANAFSGAAGSTTLTALASGSVTAAVIATGAIDADAIADNAIDAGAIAADAITAAKIADGAIDANTFAAGAITAAAIAADAIGASELAADAASEIATAVATALGTGSGFTAIPWNASWDAEVQSEVDDALVAQRLDELLNADSDIDGAAPPTVGSVFHELMSKTAGSFTFDQTTDSLEALRDRGDAAWVTATGFSTHSAADVWASATRTLTAFAFTVDSNVVQISGDSTAADNLESYADGTTPMPVNVTHFGGTAGTFASGRPNVNTSHWAGLTTVLAIDGEGVTRPLVHANVYSIDNDTAAAANAEAFFDGTGYAGAGNTIPTVTTVNGLGADAITAAATAADFGAEVADAILDRASAIDGKTVREALRIIAAMVAGILSGSQTNTEVFKGLDGTTTRATVTADSSGNRSNVVYG